MTSPPAAGACPKAAPRPQPRGVCARRFKFEFSRSLELFESAPWSAGTRRRADQTGTDEQAMGLASSPFMVDGIT
jgi:hypothetical protein